MKDEQRPTNQHPFTASILPNISWMYF